MSALSRPAVSILLLCRNEAVFIRRAIRSVLAQTIDRAVEIILMDDASVDGSAEIVQAEMAAANRAEFSLKIVRSDNNLGNGVAFVTALEAARGQFYHVLDGDDFWVDPDKLRRQVALLDAQPNLAGVAHRTILRAYEDGSESFYPQYDPLKPVLHFEDLLTGALYFHTSAMLFRNSFYDQATDKVSLPAIFREVRGDMIRLLVHASQGGIFYLPQTMSVYDDHKGGIWTGLDWPGRRDLLNTLYTQLSEHGYLAAMGEQKAAAYLADRLAGIAAYAPSSLRPISLYPEQVMATAQSRLTEVSRVSSILDLETQLSTLTAAKRYEDALRLVFRFLSAIGYDRNIARMGRTRRLFSPEIDWHCAHIGGLIAAEKTILPAAVDPQEAAQGPVVLLVSGMAEDRDGMWGATRDMIDYWRGRAKIVVLSTELLPTMPDIQDRVGADVELLLNTDQALVDKTAWLIWHVARLKPARILVNPARNDVVIAAGLRREHAPRIDLVGTYMTGYLPCVKSYALDGYVARRPYDLAWLHKQAPARGLLHLPRLVRAGTAPEPLGAGLPIVTATASLSEDGLGDPYDYSLPLMIPILLKSGGYRHVHAGPLSDAMRNRIHKELIRQDMPPEAFIHLPNPTDIGADLRAARATLFLHGFPWPDAAVLLSAMAAGLPVLAHRNYLHPALSLADLCPEGTPEWADGEQLGAIIRAIGPDWIAAQSAAICAHVAAHLSADAVQGARGDTLLAPVDPATLPAADIRDGNQELRRLMSEIVQITLFQV